MAYEIGTAYIQVLPSFDHIERELRKGAENLANQFGSAAEKAIPAAFVKGVEDGTDKAETHSRRGGARSAAAFGDAFAASLRQRMEAAFQALPEVEIDADSSAVDRALASIRSRLEKLRDQEVKVGVNDAEITRRVRRLAADLRRLEDNAPTIQLKTDAAVARTQAEEFLNSLDRRAGAFSRKFHEDLKQAISNLPSPDVDLDTDPASVKLHQLRREMQLLLEKRVGIDISEEQALKRLAAVRRALARIADESDSIELRFNADNAMKVIDGFYDSLLTTSEQAAREAAARQQKIDEDAARVRERKEEARRERDVAEAERTAKRAAERAARAAEEAFGKTFAGKVTNQLKDALNALPEFDLAVNPTQAMIWIKLIRDNLEELSGKTIGVDIDEREALLRIAELKGALVDLAANDPSIQVHVDAAAAASALAAIETMVNRLDGDQIGIDVKASGKGDVDAIGAAARLSLSRIEALVAGSLSLGTVLVPAAAAAASAIGFIGTAAAAAGAGLGALVLSFGGIGDAVKAMQKLQDDQAKAQASFSRSSAQQETAVSRIAAAERNLANTRANNAEAARSAARAVADAERSVGDARRAAADAAEQAAERVVEAQRRIADVRRDVAEAVKAATERVADSEQNLTRAQVDAREAREGLTEAYRAAVLALADLDSAVRKNALDQREANLEIKKAKEELDKFLTNPRATEEEREQARVTYERRLLQIEDLKRKGKELAEEQAEASKKGVAGSDQVVQAQKRIATADERVADAQKALTKARESVIRAQLDGARKVADAERGLAQAREGVIKAQEDGARRVSDAEGRVAEARLAQQEQGRKAAFALAQANEAIAAAGRQAEQAQVRAGVAGGEAYDNLRDSLSKLSPKAQEFAKFVFGLADDFRRLRGAAADNLLPGVQKSIETVLPLLPSFQRWLGGVAKAVGDMFANTALFLTQDATWRKFFQHIGTSTVPTLQVLYRSALNVATGVAGLITALSPFNNDIGSGLERLTERFAQWATTLERNASFQQFLGYVRQTAPDVIHLIGQLAEFVGRFVVAAAPIGSVVLHMVTGLVEGLNAIPIPVLTELVFAMGAFAAIMLVTSGVTRAYTLIQSTMNTVVGKTKGAFTGLGQAVNGVKGQMALAHATTGQFSGALNGVYAAGGLAKKGMSGLVGFLGGPWGVAISGAVLAAGYFTAKSMEQKQRVNDLSEALKLLGDAYRETRDTSSTAVRDVVAHSRELESLVVKAKDYGLAVDTIAKAASGEKAAQDEVIASLRERQAVIDQLFEDQGDFTKPKLGFEGEDKLQKERQQIEERIQALQKQFGNLNQANKAQQALTASQSLAALTIPRVTAAQADLNQKLADNQQRIDVLTGLVDAFNGAQSTAATRADALRRVIELETGAKMSAIEAEEAQARSLAGLSAAIDGNKASIKSQTAAGSLSEAEINKRARSLDVNTEAGRQNRDALEAAAGAVRDRFLADIAAGKPLEETTRLHNDRILALVKEAEKLGLDKKAARELIDAYGDIPENVKTLYETKGFDKVYDELEKLQVAQHALKYGIDPKNAWEEYKRAKAAAAGLYPQGGGMAGLKPRGDGYGVMPQFLAGGGRVWGEGTSTSDSIPAMLSNREFVQPAASVDFYGQGLMEALRHRLLPKDWLPGFATGGSVAFPFSVSALATQIPGMDEVRKAVIDAIAGIGKGSGGIGSGDMMRLLRAVFPGLALYSGYRPGSRTPSGKLSYHAMTAADGDKGRAVDLPPRQDVFNWIHDNYFSATRELIWLGDKYRNIWNGKHHKFSDSLLANHGTAGMPNAHLHWAYDQGGYLPPGFTTVYNGTGKPEPVFTDSQWGEISAMVRNNHAEPRGGETHHWHFKEAALDHGRLAAWADARDARARPGRPN